MNILSYIFVQSSVFSIMQYPKLHISLYRNGWKCNYIVTLEYLHFLWNRLANVNSTSAFQCRTRPAGQSRRKTNKVQSYTRRPKCRRQMRIHLMSKPLTSIWHPHIDPLMTIEIKTQKVLQHKIIHLKASIPKYKFTLDFVSLQWM